MVQDSWERFASMVDMRALSIVWPVEGKETRKLTQAHMLEAVLLSTGMTKYCIL